MRVPGVRRRRSARLVSVIRESQPALARAQSPPGERAGAGYLRVKTVLAARWQRSRDLAEVVRASELERTAEALDALGAIRAVDLDVRGRRPRDHAKAQHIDVVAHRAERAGGHAGGVSIR